MVDKITNSIINLDNKTSKKSATVKNSVNKVDNYRSEDSTNIKINQKKLHIHINQLFHDVREMCSRYPPRRPYSWKKLYPNWAAT